MNSPGSQKQSLRKSPFRGWKGDPFHLEHLACLFKRQARITLEQQAVIAIAEVDQKVGLPATIWEEFGIDLGQIEAAHGATIETHGTRRQDEVGATQSTVARSSGSGQRDRKSTRLNSSH